MLRASLAESRPGSWAATEVGLVVPRQNGKGAILEARELVGLFLLRERLLIHSAHQFKTAQEHFLRLVSRINEVPELKARLKPKSGIRTGAGEQGVELRSGERLRILARKGGSGRGFSAPFVALDEAMDLPESTVGDMIPTASAMPRRQRWYTGSSVDQYVHEQGVVFARVRERGIRGEDTRLAFFEWSVPETPDELTSEQMLTDEKIAEANPGYGIRISREAVEDEINALAARTAATERFGAPDWPPTSVDAEHVIDLAAWASLLDEDGEIADPVCFGMDVAPDRSRSAIAVAGRRYDGLVQVEISEHKSGTAWVVPWLEERIGRHHVERVLCAGKNAATLEPLCNQAGFEIEILPAGEEAKACGHLVDLVDSQAVRHLGSAELASALRGATKRLLDDAWRWDRRSVAVDLSPLCAATCALWGVSKYVPELAGDLAIF